MPNNNDSSWPARIGAVELRQLGLFELRTPRPAGGGVAGSKSTPFLYRRITEALERSVVAGSLTSGARLPAERQLATALGVSRATIVQAYCELEARGLVRRYVGRGTYVAATHDTSGAPFAWRGKVASTALRGADSVIRDLVRESTRPALISSAAGIPALDRFPADAFRRAVDRALQLQPAALWGHAPTEGLATLRDAVARRFGGQPERILILAGAQQGLDLLARCLVDPGDTVVIDRPGYLGALHTFRAAGARLVGWDVVRHDLDELEDLLVRYRPKLIYTNPTFHNPTGWTMPIRLRRDFLSLANRFRVPVIEDDTYRHLSLGPSPPPSLHSLDTHSIVIHLNSFSKVLAPGLRLGWLSAAEAIVDQLTLIKQRADPHTNTIVQHIVADLINEGTFDAHLAALRTEHRRRRDAVDGTLRHHLADLLQWSVPEGGLYFWCQLPPRVNSARVAAATLEASVAVAHGQMFYADRGGDRQFRVCFSSVAVNHAEEFARRLAAAIAAVRRENMAPPAAMRLVRAGQG
jgi:DNA-binding transcriptional MocR family regulator